MGCWIADVDVRLPSLLGEQVAEGGEAHVYYKGNTLIKSIGLDYYILPLMLMAEEKVVKIAVLETVDKAGNVEYGKRLLVRSNLAQAIAGTPGYEAYDRVDISAIMSEQNFQRTGNVSEDQIKKHLLGTTNKPDYARNMPNADGQPYVTMRLNYTGNGLGMAVNF